MTANRNLKRRVRTRAAKTGESYTTALRHFRPTPLGDEMSENRTVRLAVAQTTERNDPRNVDELRQGGREMRRLMREAHEAGARIVHFSEGTICWPHKLVMSVDGPDKLGPADWSRVEWDVLRAELAETAALAGKLKLWTVVGSVHQLTPPNRPYNSMYVISDKGTVETRYDERTLSYTKITYMYSPGSEPITFEVDGLRFGCALGMDVHFPELFIQYERLGVHCVLLSTAGSAPAQHHSGNGSTGACRRQCVLGELCGKCPTQQSLSVRGGITARRMGDQLSAGWHGCPDRDRCSQ